MAKKVALGKGIASLIQETPSEVVKRAKAQLDSDDQREDTQHSTPFLIEISAIQTNPNQPRKIFKQKNLEELAQSIKENGIIQPLIVAKDDQQGFELIAGERRLRAAKIAGLSKVPVVIKKATAKDKMVMAIIENVQRSDLNCVEEALAYYQLMEDYKLNQEELAKKLGKERSSVANYLRILKLPREVVELIQKDLLSFGHAKILASVKEKEDAIRYAHRAINEELSVRELEKEIKKKKPVSAPKNTQRAYNSEKLTKLRETLEKKTGFHYQLNQKENGNGQIIIKFNNEAEFNDIYEYLLRNR